MWQNSRTRGSTKTWGKVKAFFQSDLDTSTTQTYIVWGKGKEYGLVQPEVLSIETYAYKIIEIMVK